LQRWVHHHLALGMARSKAFEDGGKLIERDAATDQLPQPRVAAGTLRDRDADVFTPAQLARIHRMYRWRTIIGPSYRADMWAELEKDAKPTAELARRAYGSFATAWKVRKDWNILHAN